MCTSPNYMIPVGTHVDKNMNEVPTYKFVGHSKYKWIAEQQIPFIEVPCQRCLECRLQQTRQWSDRCVLESKNSSYNYFVTLTYDDEHLPPHASLKPDDLTQFINLLRKHFKRKLGFEGKIRFLASGEYGGSSMRPHYHIILFNCPIPDLSHEFWLEVDGKLQKHLKPESKSDLYHSMTIYDLWQRKGMISVGHFEYDTAAYVAQYVTKKIIPKLEETYKQMNLVPEFLRMSNGIGKQYFIDHPDLYDDGKLIVDCPGEAHKTSIPRYFDKLFIQKYGRDIFQGSIGSRRVIKRAENVDTNLHSGVNYEKQCEIRDHNARHKHHLKTQL